MRPIRDRVRETKGAQSFHVFASIFLKLRSRQARALTFLFSSGYSKLFLDIRGAFRAFTREFSELRREKFFLMSDGDRKRKRVSQTFDLQK